MAVETVINYFDLSNDRVFYPGTAGYQRRKFDVKPTIINDLRGREDEFTLEKNGFQVLKEVWSREDVEDVPEHIKGVVFPETIAAVKRAYVALYRIKLLRVTREADLFQNWSKRCSAVLTPRPPAFGQRGEGTGGGQGR
jgi:hypothetical protein